MIDFITGEKFIQIADFVYSSNKKDDCNKVANTFDLSLIKDGSNVYTHGMYVKELFLILKNCNKKIVLISHNSDTNIDSSFEIPACIQKWYTQNVNYSDYRIESIPIGLENSKWFPELDKKGEMISELQKSKLDKNWVYLNHTISTNLKERLMIYQLLEGKSWVDSHRGTNGKNFKVYIRNIRNHPFVICPEGNGIDTVRLWETLYMGSFPIVKRNINTSFYIDLPISFIDDWDEINEKFLNTEYNRIRSGIWNMEKLKFDYWKTKILNYAKN